MAATGKTPILLYGSTTATNVPVAGNLTNSSDGCEIAINVADKNLFFKDSTNAVNTVPIRQSSGSSDGWLSSANWTTFNSKQTAYTNLTSIGSLANATGWLYNNGSGTFSYSTPSKSDVGLGNVTNDAQTKAAIVPNTAPSAGQILVGNAGGTAYAPVSMSGDATLASTGAATLATVNSNVGSYTNASITVNAKGLVTAASSGTAPVTSVTGTAPVVSSGGTTPAISMAAATGSVNGYLTSTDWTTFNNKANAFTYTSNYIPYGQGTTTPNQSSALTFNGTSLQTTGTFYSTGTTGLTWNSGSASTAQVVVGTTGSASSVFINTPSVNSLYGSGLGIDGTYSSTNSVIQLHAYGAKSGGGYNGSFSFWTSYLTTETEQLTIASNTGNVTVKTGNLVIGTSGKGIDFSATAGTGTSELLADYEEGTWTPGQGSGLTVVGTFSSSGSYTKVGNLVYVKGLLSATTSIASGAGGEFCTGLPYTALANSVGVCTNAGYTATTGVRAINANLYVVTAQAATTSLAFSITYQV